MKRAKIVCTLGPSCASKERIGALIDSGMDVARLNFSHGSPVFHQGLFDLVRQEAKARNRAVAILQDLQGPKLRIGRFEKPIMLSPGQIFSLTSDPISGTSEAVSISYPEIIRELKPGNRISLDDGRIVLEVVHTSEKTVDTQVINGGPLSDHKGMNLPGVALSIRALTDQDREHMRWGAKMGVDFIALSFVRGPYDVREAIDFLLHQTQQKPIPIIAKIEKPEAVEQLAAIIDLADGVMIARGDLGVEVGPEKVPLVQKRIIEETNARGKVVITATQMLESMIESPTATRAEVSDVANAVLDGTDALMLSGETAAGKHPLEAAQTMARIIEEIEKNALFRGRFDTALLSFHHSANAIAKSAVVAARQMKARAIVCVTASGGVARLVSEYRPEMELLALTSREDVYRQLALYWGVEPIIFPIPANFDEMVQSIGRMLSQRPGFKTGDLAVIAAAIPSGVGISANTLHILKVP